MPSATEVAAVISAIGASGIAGAAVKIRISGAERESIGNAASAAAVDVFESSIENLKGDLTRARADTEQVRSEAREREDAMRTEHRDEIAHMRANDEAEIGTLRAELHQIRDELRRFTRDP